MNHYRWNMLNDRNDMVFVFNIENAQVVLKNNVFDELVNGVVGGLNLELADLVPQKEGCDDLLVEVVNYLAQSGGKRYDAYFEQCLMGHLHAVRVIADYFDDAHTEVSVILKGYQSIVQFIRFQKSLEHIPENTVLLALDDQLSFYSGNQEFIKTFAAGDLGRFIQTFGGHFAPLLEETTRAQTLLQIKDAIQKEGRCSLIVQLQTLQDEQHYAIFTARKADTLLGHVLLCATIQIVDESVQQYLHLQNEHEVYSVASHFSSSVLFRLNVQTMSVEFYGELIENFALSKMCSNVVQDMLERNLVYPEDVPRFNAMLADMKKGIECPARLRLCAKDGRNDWYLIEYKMFNDLAGEPLQALGKISNVQKDQELQEKASLDLLTSCLNKGTFEALCMNLLNTRALEESHAFLIIDIDNFKAVNDNLGHFFGDIVLKEIATKLKRIFRASDYISRIGGDEFAVLMKEIKTEDSVYRKAKEVIDAIDITYRGDNTSYRISASVGIALYPAQADNYEDIYKRADIALYHAKNTGKNAYKVYDESLVLGSMANTTPFDVANRAFSHFFDQQVAMDTFNLLFEATNNHDSINMVLRHLGERFGVDRCYIFEAQTDDCLAYNNTYEWCREGIAPEMDNLQGIAYDCFNEVFALANAEGVFYCDDVSTIKTPNARAILSTQGIVSMLHTYVKHGARVKYALGFDDCTAKRLWKPSEISTLMYASKIIAQFLLYNEAIERAAASVREQLEIMDNLNFYAYVIDNATHRIQYINNRCSELIPNIQEGDLCYKVIRGKDCECEDCPLKTLRAHHASKARTMIHNELLDADFLATASALSSFGGKACTFVSVTDITDVLKTAQIPREEYENFLVFEK